MAAKSIGAKISIRLVKVLAAEAIAVGVTSFIDAQFLARNAVWFVAAGVGGLFVAALWEQIGEFIEWKRVHRRAVEGVAIAGGSSATPPPPTSSPSPLPLPLPSPPSPPAPSPADIALSALAKLQQLQGLLGTVPKLPSGMNLHNNTGQGEQVESHLWRIARALGEGVEGDRTRSMFFPELQSAKAFALTDPAAGEMLEGDQEKFGSQAAKQQWHVLYRMRQALIIAINRRIQGLEREAGPLLTAPGVGTVRRLETLPSPGAQQKLVDPYREAVLQLEEAKVTKMASSDGEITAVECHLVLTSKATLSHCQIWISAVRAAEIERPAAFVRTGRLQNGKGPNEFQIIRTGQSSARVLLIRRDRKDIVSNPPFLILTDRGDFPLSDSTDYLVDLELRSEAKYPTLVTLRVKTGVKDELDVGVESQTV
jgi:hypothetical protein